MLFADNTPTSSSADINKSIGFGSVPDFYGRLGHNIVKASGSIGTRRSASLAKDNIKMAYETSLIIRTLFSFILITLHMSFFFLFQHFARRGGGDILPLNNLKNLNLNQNVSSKEINNGGHHQRFQ